MRRPPLPAFLADITAEPRAFNALLAGSAALFAAGLDPKVWSASLPSVQAAIRLRPELEALTLIAAVLGAGLLLVGGAIGDTNRARPIVLGGLAIAMAASAVSLVTGDGPLFTISRFVGHASSSFVIPVALASVAVSYSGVARATAIGLAYGAYGASGAVGPTLLQLIPGASWPAFVAAIAACGLAFVIARRRLPVLPRPSMVERPYVVATALWGFGIVTLTTAIVWFGAGWDSPVRWALIGIGALSLVGAGIHERRRGRPEAAVQIERRPVAIAVGVGLILALAQTVPMLQLPLYFRVVLQYGPLAATAALAPLFAALILAGPVAGMLLSRYRPRTLVGAGVVAVGIGDLALALVTSPEAGYLGFIVPCLLVGAGFVIATTVRTAIIFASVPRGLPATAAALNEASIAVGSRIGIVLVTAIVAQTSLAVYQSGLVGTPAEIEAAMAAFRDVLTAIGTPSFTAVASTVDPGDLRPYVEAYSAGVRVALGFGAVIALVGGAVAWFFLGRGAPLTSVWEHRDERAEAPA